MIEGNSQYPCRQLHRSGRSRLRRQQKTRRSGFF